MDNKKGKKGKLVFYKLFSIEYVFKYNIYNKIFVIGLVMDNGKVKKVMNIFNIFFYFIVWCKIKYYKPKIW